MKKHIAIVTSALVLGLSSSVAYAANCVDGLSDVTGNMCTAECIDGFDANGKACMVGQNTPTDPQNGGNVENFQPSGDVISDENFSGETSLSKEVLPKKLTKEKTYSPSEIAEANREAYNLAVDARNAASVAAHRRSRPDNGVTIERFDVGGKPAMTREVLKDTLKIMNADETLHSIKVADETFKLPEVIIDTLGMSGAQAYSFTNLRGNKDGHYRTYCGGNLLENLYSNDNLRSICVGSIYAGMVRVGNTVPALMKPAYFICNTEADNPTTKESHECKWDPVPKSSLAGTVDKYNIKEAYDFLSHKDDVTANGTVFPGMANNKHIIKGHVTRVTK